MKHYYDFTVVGAGPAGILLIAAIAEEVGCIAGKILWIDPHFKCGYLNLLDPVPSLSLFNKIKWIEVDIFSDDEFYSLQIYKRILGRFQEQILHQMKNLELKYGKVSSLSYDSNSSLWNLSMIQNNLLESVSTRYLFLATGAHPKTIVTPLLNHIPLEIVLRGGYHLYSLINSLTSIAVLGSSHSAALCLMNIFSLPKIPPKVYHFIKKPFYFSKEDPLTDKIVYNNTGLKGRVAEWISLNYPSSLSPYLEVISSDNLTTNFIKDHDITCLVVAVGYEANRVPTITIDNLLIPIHLISYENISGQLQQNSLVLPKAYGFGIAFPEKIFTSTGSEYDVGIWKFAKRIKSCVSQALSTKSNNHS